MGLNFIQGHDLFFGPIRISLALQKVVLTQQGKPEIRR